MRSDIQAIHEILVQLHREVELIKHLAPLVKELRAAPSPRRARARVPLPPATGSDPPADIAL